jgi:eukaryotic-like serine/threonine-protein kinase
MDATIIDGRYLLIETLGSGGEANVYRALDNVDKTEVALRLSLYLGTLPEAVGVKPPATLHPGWVRLLTPGTDQVNGDYQIFELLEGATLSNLIKNAPLDTDAWRLFADQSLDAVEALHAAGWVHGDLNADNFFHTTSGWKLLELPFYRLTPPEARSPIFGSIHTLAPEQIDGAEADVLSDLYSLGCLYYYAASGAYPHPGATSQEVAIHCLLFPPEPLGDKAPHLPAAWADWVMNLLARERAQRISSVAGAHQLLRDAVA